MVDSQVRLVDVSVIRFELLLPSRGGDFALLIEMPGLPLDLPSGLEDLRLPHHLKGQSPLHILQAGDVLDLASLLADGYVAVAADAPLAVGFKIYRVPYISQKRGQESPGLCRG
ncbi:hypothetical protein SDC9_181438 [bioreactor metagenome]|uniref:Uncharacterized protein n=1 Tax=bioreactor metagenome TaxID=1076179 RepID=A0A645H628_9ZZZZ